MRLFDTETDYLRATLAKLEVEFTNSNTVVPNPDFSEQISQVLSKAARAVDQRDLPVAREYIHALREMKVEILRAEDVFPALDSMRQSVLRSQMSSETKKAYNKSVDAAATNAGPDQAVARALLRRILNRVHSDAQTRSWKLTMYRRVLRYFASAAAAILGLLSTSVLLRPLSSITTDSPVLLLDVGLLGSLGALVNGMRTLRRIELDLMSYNVLVVTAFAQPVAGFALAVVAFLVLRSGLISVVGVQGNVFALLVLGFAAGFSEGFILRLVGSVEAKIKNGEVRDPPSGPSS